MGNLQSVTDLTRLVQDVQYTTALKGLTEQQKQSYFNSQKQELLGNILNDREGTFQKTFVDATRNNSLQQSLFFYQQRNRDIENVGNALENQNESSIGVARYNNQLATRQYEIIEWSYNN
jgi:ketol-acid reductoisomerase